jgi:ketosteroid isomerase-like protein
MHMRVSIPILLEAAYASWAAQDLDATMACFAEDVVFATHLPADVVPFAGVSRGKVELRRQLQIIIDQFEFLTYRPVRISTEGRLFRSQVKMHYRHRATGLTYKGRLRHVWEIEGDKITHFEEFHDPDRVRAFFQLIALYGPPP